MRLSFVVPVYNAEKYLEECLSSLLKAGEGYDVEFILVNDGSKDTSLSICRRYEAEDDRFTVIDQVNQGSQSARNAGIRVAGGEYICFVDSDDYISNDLTADLVDVIEKQGSDIILYDAARISDDGKIISEVVHDIDSGLYTDEAYLNVISHSLFVTHDLYGIRKLNGTLWSKCIRSKIIKDVIDSFDCSIELGEDLGISAAVVMKASSAFKLSGKAYYFYRDNPGSIMNRYKEDLFDKSMRLCDFIARQNVDNAEFFNVGVAYERCFFAISSYYNEYFYKSDRSSDIKKQTVKDIIDSSKLQEALLRINLDEVKNPNRIILKFMKNGAFNTLSFLGNVIYFLSPLLRKVIRL